jgi:hypothetical protein
MRTKHKVSLLLHDELLIYFFPTGTHNSVLH